MLMEGEGEKLLASIGKVLRVAGISDKGEVKFQNIRGCVLMDMSKALPSVLRLNLNGEVKRIAIKYDTLPDACFVCQERGHFARTCPQKGKQGGHQNTDQENQSGRDGFIPVGRRAPMHQPQAQHNTNPAPSTSNPYSHLDIDQEDEESEQSEPDEGDNETQMAVDEVQAREAANAMVTPAGENNDNSTGAAARQGVRAHQKEGEKKSKNLEARRLRASKGLPPASTPTHKSKGKAEDHSDGESSGSDSETGGMWQQPSDKKSKGGKETMDTEGNWAVQATQQTPT
ncbi:hypothetical protein R1sor_014054 [Riccia sorocarpa]|uniref:CCHC-type domain-containing protein n=1 Tax=Riccia sorocarpa TaxID=122646 RepID=A0ABD3HBH6_9MARC